MPIGMAKKRYRKVFIYTGGSRQRKLGLANVNDITAYYTALRHLLPAGTQYTPVLRRITINFDTTSDLDFQLDFRLSKTKTYNNENPKIPVNSGPLSFVCRWSRNQHK
jgi:hypothetical protein